MKRTLLSNLISSLLALAGIFSAAHQAHAQDISPSAAVYQIDENTYAIQDESGEVSFRTDIGFKFPRIPGFPGRGGRDDRDNRGGGGGRYNPRPPSCESCNAFGCYTSGGGCGAFGCYVYQGGCNAFGCWYPGGMCNAFGCANEATKSAGKCN